MLFSNVLHVFTFSVAISQIPQISAVPADGQPNALLPTWELADLPGSRDTGRCIGQDLDMLKASYEDACLISQKAYADMNFFATTTAATKGKGPAKGGVLKVSTDYERWHRIFATYISLFGSRPFEDEGALTSGFQGIQQFYRVMENTYCKGDMRQYVYVFCTDGHYKFITTGSPDPGDSQNRNIEITHPQCQEVGGTWYTDQMPAEFRYFGQPPARVPGRGPICDDKILASTLDNQRAIIFCTSGLDPKTHTAVTISNLRPVIKAAKTRIKKGEFLSRIADRSVTLLQDLNGDGGELMPVTWIHEMVHLILHSEDEPAVDKKGAALMREKFHWNTEKMDWELKEEQDLTYGYDLCRNLAEWDPDLTLRNPDNIAFFGTAMFLDEWDWSRGYAMPKKKTG